jgi:uncharacterized membrane protein YdjX (TVP38/TMEM64 family)
MIMFVLNQERAIQLIFKYKQWIRQHFWESVAILTISHIVGCLLVFPGAIFGIACGFVFGTYFAGSALGYIFCVFAYMNMAVISGLITFNFAKMCLGSRIRRLMILPNRRLRALDYVLTKHGAKAIFLLRLSPILPVSLLNYLFSGFSSKSLIKQ